MAACTMCIQYYFHVHACCVTFQQECVVVDTVLITDLPENSIQKAITHASGTVHGSKL